jgi:hypothetical protein
MVVAVALYQRQACVDLSERLIAMSSKQSEKVPRPAIAKVPYRVVKVAGHPDRYAVDVEEGWRIVFWREGHQCKVRVEIAPSEQGRKQDISANAKVQKGPVGKSRRQAARPHGIC